MPDYLILVGCHGDHSLSMAMTRVPNPMKEAHIHRLEQNWHLVKRHLDLDDIIYILKDKGVLDTNDVELIETYSSKKGFKYLFVALTEYGGAKGLHVFVDALKLKDNKYATIISELSEELEEPNLCLSLSQELDEKDKKIVQLQRDLEVERRMRKELEYKLAKMKMDSASKDKEIHHLKTVLDSVTERVKDLEKSIQDMREGKNPEIRKLVQEMIQCQLNSQGNVNIQTRPRFPGSLPGTNQANNQRETSTGAKHTKKWLPHLQSPRK